MYDYNKKTNAEQDKYLGRETNYNIRSSLIYVFTMSNSFRDGTNLTKSHGLLFWIKNMTIEDKRDETMNMKNLVQ